MLTFTCPSACWTSKYLYSYENKNQQLTEVVFPAAYDGIDPLRSLPVKLEGRKLNKTHTVLSQALGGKEETWRVYHHGRSSGVYLCRLKPDPPSGGPRALSAPDTAPPAAAPSAPAPRRKENRRRKDRAFSSKGSLKYLHSGVQSNFRSGVIPSQQVTLKEMEFIVLSWSANQFHTTNNVNTLIRPTPGERFALLKWENKQSCSRHQKSRDTHGMRTRRMRHLGVVYYFRPHWAGRQTKRKQRKWVQSDN